MGYLLTILFACQNVKKCEKNTLPGTISSFFLFSFTNRGLMSVSKVEESTLQAFQVCFEMQSGRDVVSSLQGYSDTIIKI